MTDHTHAGARCRMVRHVNTHEGALRRDIYGTIRYEVDNFDRHLVFVDWDNGISVAVFPQEIEIVAAYEQLAA